ncbi:MAG: hypothetical protein LBU83_05955 [Bacteroidales bacterium]|jgi:hypothetical protein|nr:hypothetical protein [Bacteroidales bacterium]
MINLKFKIQNSKLLLPFYLFSFLLFLLLTFSSCDKQEMLYGSWNLQTATMNGKPLNDSLQFNAIPAYTYYSFLYENRLTVRTFAMGQITSSPDGFYKLDKKLNLEMSFTILHKRYNIRAKIKKLTKKELNLEYEENGNKFFLKLFTK